MKKNLPGIRAFAKNMNLTGHNDINFAERACLRNDRRLISKLHTFQTFWGATSRSPPSGARQKLYIQFIMHYKMRSLRLRESRKLARKTDVNIHNS